jgi:hypothetical protein
MLSAVGDFTRQDIFDDKCNSSLSFLTGLFKRTFYRRNNYYNNEVSLCVYHCILNPPKSHICLPGTISIVGSSRACNH